MITDDHPANPNPQDQSNFSWLRSAFFLRWAYLRKPSDSSNPTHDPPNNATSPITQVTLICFGAPPLLIERFERLLQHHNWRQVMENPFSLWVVVMDELFKHMDDQVWNLGTVFRGIERVSIFF